MKKETYEKAANLRDQIWRLQRLISREHNTCLSIVEFFGAGNGIVNQTDKLTDRLIDKVQKWNKELKTLIAEELAALEKEFAELSDETITEKQ